MFLGLTLDIKLCLYFDQAGEDGEPIPHQTDEIPEELEDDVSEGTTILEEDIEEEEGEMRNNMVDIWTAVNGELPSFVFHLIICSSL